MSGEPTQSGPDRRDDQRQTRAHFTVKTSRALLVVSRVVSTTNPYSARRLAGDRASLMVLESTRRANRTGSSVRNPHIITALDVNATIARGPMTMKLMLVSIAIAGAIACTAPRDASSSGSAG